ncbi:hypothetical protein NBE98_15185 [Clostridium swellfunianum]|nr:hypothetical protein [Clostridium swellfunianum]
MPNTLGTGSASPLTALSLAPMFSLPCQKVGMSPPYIKLLFSIRLYLLATCPSSSWKASK